MSLFEERTKQLPVILPLNSNTISANEINHYYEIEKDERVGTVRIDLHGYSVEEAQDWVNRAIKFHYSNEYCNSIFFITGRGKHVNNKGERGTLFKLFPQWLKDENISHMIEKCESQIGAYEVILKKNSGSSLALKFEVIYSLATELGLPSYQFYLGIRYYRGKGIKKDDKEAAKWFLKAAKQGLSEAQLMLGVLYYMGRGVGHDSQKALYWYHMAARQNNPNAMKNIAIHHIRKMDYQNARNWFRKAFEAGDAGSANQIGIMYKFGIGTSCDLQKAGEWYRKAAEADDNHGKVNLGTHLLESGNKEEGMKWIKEAAIEGLADAQLHLGEAYYLQGDVDEAKKWMLKSAMQNAGKSSGCAQFFLGCLAEDFEQKLNWFRKAADNDVKIAQNTLANIYRSGDMGLKDDAKAFSLYRKAANDTKRYAYNEKGIPSAQYTLGECYELGLLKINKNPKKALKWYKEAAKREYPLALKRLGIIQENNLTLTQIQEKLKGMYTLPTPEELAKTNISIYISGYVRKTSSEKYIALKRATDELNDLDEIHGYVYLISVKFMEPLADEKPLKPPTIFVLMCSFILLVMYFILSYFVFFILSYFKFFTLSYFVPFILPFIFICKSFCKK